MKLMDFEHWIWTIMIVPLIALFTGKADKSEITEVNAALSLKAEKSEVQEAHNEVDQMRKELSHITDRVDKIYDHLINNKQGG